MTTTSSTAQEFQQLEEPAYDGPSAADIREHLRSVGRFGEYAARTVEISDVERALDAARLARAEIDRAIDGLEQARPAARLTWQAAEARRVAPGWEPATEQHDGPPLVDATWTDPVLVAAGDLMAMTHGWASADRPAPPEALRAFCQLARQQPHRVEDLPVVVGAAFPQIRGALVRDGCLPDSMR